MNLLLQSRCLIPLQIRWLSVNERDGFEQKNQSSILTPVNLTSLRMLQFNNTNDLYIRRFRNHHLVDTSNVIDYFLNDIYLFVVNFHFPMYNYSNFIETEIYGNFALYYPYDFDLVMLGPEMDIENGIISNGLPIAGYYSYHTMAVAISLFPPHEGYNYAGYFLANDDSCLQPTFLGREDHHRAMREKVSVWENNKSWMWNAMYNRNHVTFARAFLEAVDAINSDPSLNSICKLNETTLQKGWGDFFYFPRSFVTSFLRLEAILFNKGVFLENAVPILLMCADAVTIDDCNHGPMPNRRTCAHFHPVKFSEAAERRICLNRIKNISLSQRPNTWCCVCYNNEAQRMEAKEAARLLIIFVNPKSHQILFSS